MNMPQLKFPIRNFVGATLLLGLAACTHQAPEQESVSKVAWFTVQEASSTQATFTGVVHARTESNLGFRVAGKIVERLVDPGQTVHKGQPLMRIDAVDYDLALAASHAAVEAAKAKQTQAVAEEARLRNLLANGATSATNYELAKANADAAIAQTKAEVASANETEHQRDYAVLVADMDGVVLEVPTDVGQVVPAGQTVVRLARTGPREALVYLPEQELPLAKRPATASLYSEPANAASATLRELAAVADPQTRTYLARYVLGGSTSQAPIGATVTVKIATASPNGVSVPVSALVDEGQGVGVWLIDNKTSTVHFQPVKVEQLGEEQAHVSQGLTKGEQVVAVGGHLLTAGQKVQLLPETKMGSKS